MEDIWVNFNNRGKFAFNKERNVTRRIIIILRFPAFVLSRENNLRTVDKRRYISTTINHSVSLKAVNARRVYGFYYFLLMNPQSP